MTLQIYYKLMNDKIQNSLMKLASYLYLYLTYIAIVFYFSYKGGILGDYFDIGYLSVILRTLAYFIAYIAMNHLVVIKIVSSKIVITVEMVLTITLLTMCCSDILLMIS